MGISVGFVVVSGGFLRAGFGEIRYTESNITEKLYGVLTPAATMMVLHRKIKKVQPQGVQGEMFYRK